MFEANSYLKLLKVYDIKQMSFILELKMTKVHLHQQLSVLKCKTLSTTTQISLLALWWGWLCGSVDYEVVSLLAIIPKRKYKVPI